MCLKLFFWKKTPYVHIVRLEAEENSPNVLLHFLRGNTLNFQTVRNSGRRVIEWVLKEFPAKVQILSICKSSQKALNAFAIIYSTYAIFSYCSILSFKYIAKLSRWNYAKNTLPRWCFSSASKFHEFHYKVTYEVLWVVNKTIFESRKVADAST